MSQGGGGLPRHRADGLVPLSTMKEGVKGKWVGEFCIEHDYLFNLYM